MSPIILNNSRDINNKFLFGHWMMRPKNNQLPFKGPGYGRANYWMFTPDYKTITSSMKLDRVEQDMIMMKSLGLKGYIIEFCGKISIGDGCWTCCNNDRSLIDSLPDSAWEKDGEGALGEGWEPNWDSVETNYFKDDWYEEARIKYKELIKLCRKYNMWLLNFVFNDNRWQKCGIQSRLKGWINEYGAWKPENQEVGSNSGGLEHGPGTRQEELRSAIKDKLGSVMPPNIPSTENLEKLMTEIILPAGGQERVVICPVNEPETNGSGDYPDHNGIKFEETWIPKIKQKGFASCTYGEIKYGARFYQDGHNGSIETAKCPKGFGVSDNGNLLCELYFGTTEEVAWEDINGDATAIKENVRNLIRNYKKSNARAGMLYAIHYRASTPDEDALQGVKEGWYNNG